MECEWFTVRKQVLGEEHLATLATASNLASSLADQGQKAAESEAVTREIYATEQQAQDQWLLVDFGQKEAAALCPTYVNLHASRQGRLSAGGKCPGREFAWVTGHLAGGSGWFNVGDLDGSVGRGDTAVARETAHYRPLAGESRIV